MSSADDLDEREPPSPSEAGTTLSWMQFPLTELVESVVLHAVREKTVRFKELFCIKQEALWWLKYISQQIMDKYGLMMY